MIFLISNNLLIVVKYKTLNKLQNNEIYAINNKIYWLQNILQKPMEISLYLNLITICPPSKADMIVIELFTYLNFC